MGVNHAHSFTHLLTPVGQLQAVGSLSMFLGSRRNLDNLEEPMQTQGEYALRTQSNSS